MTRQKVRGHAANFWNLDWDCGRFFLSGNVPWNSAEEDCRYFDLFRARRGPAGDRHRGVGDQLGDVIA